MKRPKMKYHRDLAYCTSITANPTDKAKAWLLEKVVNYNAKFGMSVPQAITNILGNRLKETYEIKRWVALHGAADSLKLFEK